MTSLRPLHPPSEPEKNTAPGWVLITGASEGMGHEFAKRFARDGHSLILIARNESKLRQIEDQLIAENHIDVRVIPMDLSLPDSAERLKEELDRQGMPISILVNNAGFGVHGLFHESDWPDLESMLTLNTLTLTRLTHLLLPAMIEKKYGRILNVASTAAFQPGPLMACYFASKAYVLSFTEALAEELTGTGVSVTAFCPGPTRTRFQERSGTIYTRENYFAMDAAPAVDAAYRGMMRGKTLVIPGFWNNLLAFLVRLTPRKTAAKAARFIEESK